ncbi:hypothetical protein QJS10_CPB17g00805 [Acorus calamus]|uniref:Reverse transcriptase n=1 Tax=Acorus calamus TaxID=4465 RepID=A0AAV9CWK0_ACOCL|nr:hypothetical protein QJS10_CPB17g00805 [Acorus calamus]
MLFEATEADARVARFITFCFELVSGLSLNWSKSALLAVNVPEPQRQALARIVGCEVRDFPAHVLGLPLSRGFEDWDPLIERFQRRLAGWKVDSSLTEGGSRCSKQCSPCSHYFFSRSSGSPQECCNA